MTNSWIVYQIESVIEVKKATINILGCGRQMGIGSVPDCWATDILELFI